MKNKKGSSVGQTPKKLKPSSVGSGAMVRRNKAALAEMAARVSNDISEGYDNGESRAELRACIGWWASRCSDLTMAYRAVEGAAVTLEVTTWRESDKPAVTARELLKDARARGEKTINA